MECINNGATVKVYLPDKADKEYITCNRNEANLYKSFEYTTDDAVTGGFVLCPNPKNYCIDGLQCPDDCNGHGRCLKSKKCFCYYGWTGESCNTQVTGDAKAAQYTIIDASILGSHILRLKIVVTFGALFTVFFNNLY